MWLMMIMSYTLVSIMDIRSFSKQNEKGRLPLYIVLMVISCAIGIARGYVAKLPSPADPIRDLILSITGR